MNPNLLTHTIEKSKRVDYSDQAVKLISRFIEYLRKNHMGKGTSYAQGYFLHKIFKGLDEKGMVC